MLLEQDTFSCLEMISGSCYDDPNVKSLAERLKAESPDELSLINNTFHFVRDEIRHSWDAQDTRVTVSAGDTLREGVGICWAKANFACLCVKCILALK